MNKRIRDGKEVYRSEQEIIEEVDVHSDEELFRQVARYYTNEECNLPIKGIIKDAQKAAEGYVKKMGMSNG